MTGIIVFLRSRLNDGRHFSGNGTQTFFKANAADLPELLFDLAY
jgi:hypothetical protein